MPDDGLAGLDTDDHDQTLALARRLVDPDAADDASLEAMFAATRALEAEAEEYLDEAHRLDPEPAPPPMQLTARAPTTDTVPRAAPASAVPAQPARRVAQLALDLAACTPPATSTDERDEAGPVVLPPIGRVMRFEDLAALTRPLSRRRKGKLSGQLDLFTS